MIEASYQLQRPSFKLDVSFNLPARGVIALFGSSGSGKTTVLRCMAGLEQGAKGYLKLDGVVWQDKTANLPVHKRKIGYVFQDANLFEHLNVDQNIKYGWKRTPPTQRKITVQETVEWLGLSQLLERYPSELSGGQRQRVAIARALVTSPALLLMDEPLASLDLKSKEEILPYLEQLHNQLEIPIVYVSHAPAEVIRLADHMVLLDQGRVLAQGPTNELLTRTDLPLAHLDESAALVYGYVSEHEADYHLSHVEVEGQRLSVSLQDIELGEKVRMRVAARDVSISINKPNKSSISNAVKCETISLDPSKEKAKLIVKLRFGQQYLLAHITHKSADTLDLKPGQNVYAQVKSVALMS